MWRNLEEYKDEQRGVVETILKESYCSIKDMIATYKFVLTYFPEANFNCTHSILTVLMYENTIMNL